MGRCGFVGAGFDFVVNQGQASGFPVLPAPRRQGDGFGPAGGAPAARGGMGSTFDKMARLYRWLEYVAFQKDLERCRFALLPALEGCQRVLTIGEGDGRFVAELVRRYPTIEVDCLEGSAAMIARAKERLPGGTSATFYHVDALAWEYPADRYDAVVTCFFLDCFTASTLSGWLDRSRRTLRPSGLWAVAEFSDTQTGWRRWSHRLLLSVMYAFFRVMTRLEAGALPDWKGIFIEQGAIREQGGGLRGGLMEWSVWRWGRSEMTR